MQPIKPNKLLVCSSLQSVPLLLIRVLHAAVHLLDSFLLNYR